MPPTIILVHGAFAESASWNAVVDALADEGLPVIAAANPLRGLAADAEAVTAHLISEAAAVHAAA